VTSTPAYVLLVGWVSGASQLTELRIKLICTEVPGETIPEFAARVGAVHVRPKGPTLGSFEIPNFTAYLAKRRLLPASARGFPWASQFDFLGRFRSENYP